MFSSLYILIKCPEHITHRTIKLYVFIHIQLEIQRFFIHYDKMLSSKFPYKSCRWIYL